MQAISKHEFDTFNIMRMAPEAIAPITEIEWYKTAGNKLATLTLDKFERDYGYIIMEQKDDEQYIAVNVDRAIKTREQALEELSHTCKRN